MQAHKYQNLRNLAKHHKIDTLVETGTWIGGCVQYATHDPSLFKQVYSIELSLDFFQKAQEQFKDQKNLKLFHGDSGEVLPIVLDLLQAPAIFWLDAHWSGGETAKGDKNTPIIEELHAIAKHRIKKHVLMIDDAQDFSVENYPRTESYPRQIEIFLLARELFPQHSCDIVQDAFRIIPHH